MSNIVKYYNDIASIYDQDRFGNSYGKFIDFQERKILDSLLGSENKNSLDLACGSGRLSNYTTMGSDASEEMLKIARKKFPDKLFIQCDAEKLPFDDKELSNVISFHFFMHLDKSKIRLIFKEIHRILEENGTFIFDIPSQNRRSLFRYHSENWHGSTSYTKKELQEDVSKLFVIETFHSYLFLPVHRFPKISRKLILSLDLILCKSFLRKYASYFVFQLKKI